MAHCLFGLYQRVVLLPLSALTNVNLNYTLCASNGIYYLFWFIKIKIVDPFIPLVGNYYYFLSDFYLFLGGEIFHRFLKVVLIILKKITAELHIKELNEDKKSD